MRWLAVFLLGLTGVLTLAAIVVVLLFFSGDGIVTDGFESGRIDESVWLVDRKGECRVEASEERAASGRYAIRFLAGTGSRCEVVPRVYRGPIAKYRREPYGEERWYVFSTLLAEPWPPNVQNEIIAQWHGSADKALGDVPSRGPPLAIRIYGKDFRITHGFDAAFVSTTKWISRQPLWAGPVVTDTWLHWRVQALWSHERDGLLRIWLNDELIVDHAGPNTYNDLRGVYLKLGPYHPDSERLFFLDDVHIGDVPPPP